jgi:hypothetical protein
LENGFSKWVNAPQLCGIDQDSRCRGTILFYFVNELTGRTAIEFPPQLQVQNIFCETAEKLEFCCHVRPPFSVCAGNFDSPPG